MKVRNINEELRWVTDKELLKYKRLNLREKLGESPSNVNDSLVYENTVGGVDFPDLTTIDFDSYVRSEDAGTFNVVISDYLRKLSKENSWWGGESNRGPRPILISEVGTGDAEGGRERSGIKTVISKIKSYFSERKLRKNYILDVTDVFSTIKILVGKEQEFIDRVKEYLSLIRKSQRLHQKAHEESLLKGLVVHIYESILSVSGYNRYITLGTLKSLQSKCSRDLSLDYIENYVRIIPDSVADKKDRADQLGVFDNYVILHYDPENKATEKTEAQKKKEEERRRDPILFGVICGSDKLYYIDSWVDEYCDMTLDKIVEILGEGAIGKLDENAKQ